jgi:CHASE2 domain-containing sensor protein
MRGSWIAKKLKATAAQAANLLVRRIGTRFYVALALVFTLALLLDYSTTRYLNIITNGAFDLLMRNRLNVPAPDPDIVILDINEPSLAAMAADYGRWPWPRQVLGEMVEAIERQRPAAIVFDILLSDADVFNPDSEAAFDQTIAKYDNLFFPMLRLGPSSDSASRIRPSMIPGVAEIPGRSAEDRPLGIVLPRFDGALKAGRLGTHNAIPDIDGVQRRYLVRSDHAGWNIPSLPSALAIYLGVPLPQSDTILLNWRGPPFTYRNVAFSDAFFDALRKKKTRAQDEFAGKIVIIGSTAPSLYDVKASPLSKVHPGVEVLATAIDNLRHQDYLRESPLVLQVAAAIGFVWLICAAFVRRVPAAAIDSGFGMTQFSLILIAYLALSYATRHVHLSGPLAVALAYFSVARAHLMLSERLLANRRLFVEEPRPGMAQRLRILAIRHPFTAPADRKRLLRKVSRLVRESRADAGWVENLFDQDGLIHRMFADTLVVFWMFAASDAAAELACERDSQRISEALAAFAAGRKKGGHLQVRSRCGDLGEGADWLDRGRDLVYSALAGSAATAAPEAATDHAAVMR